MNMRIYLTFTTFLLFIVNAALCQTILTGELSGTYKQGTYIVSGSVIVLPLNTLRFLPGTKIYFDQFSGLCIQGELICEGTQDSTILFESKNALTSRLPEPLDWNGISVSGSASQVRLAYCTIAHCVYGIKVDSLKTPFNLDHVVFNENGSSNLSRGGNVLFVKNNTSVSYECSGEMSGCVLIEDISVSVAKKPKTLKKNNASGKPANIARPVSWELPVRFTLGSICLAGAGVWLYGYLEAEKYHKQYENVTSDPVQIVAPKNNRDKAVGIRNIGMIVCIMGAAGFCVTFLF